jgi:hypothetical protein
MTFEEAQDYAIRYGRRAKKLVRLNRQNLRVILNGLMAGAGRVLLAGQFSKDELITEILKLEFPAIQEADGVRAQRTLEGQ